MAGTEAPSLAERRGQQRLLLSYGTALVLDPGVSTGLLAFDPHDRQDCSAVAACGVDSAKGVFDSGVTPTYGVSGCRTVLISGS